MPDQAEYLFGLKIFKNKKMGVRLLGNSCFCAMPMWTWKKRSPLPLNFNRNSISSSRRPVVRAFFLDPNQVPILKEAVKEPVAFMGGLFAGVLRLDLDEDPLKEWVSRTVEASGVSLEEISEEGSKVEEDTPQEIEIE